MQTAMSRPSAQLAIGVSFITSNTNSKEVALPSNTDWIDYWNEDNVYKAGSTVGYTAPLEQCPIFIKPGAIIPMNVRKD